MGECRSALGDGDGDDGVGEGVTGVAMPVAAPAASTASVATPPRSTTARAAARRGTRPRRRQDGAGAPGRARSARSASVQGASETAPRPGATLEPTPSAAAGQEPAQDLCVVPSRPSAKSRYELCAVPCHANGMLLDQVGVDFIALENRVAELERQMRVDYEVLPPIVQDLKQEVTRFRAKLEKTEHLGWMGYYKELPPPEDCRRLQYRRRSHEEQRRVKEHFLEICDVPPSEEIKDALKTALFDCSPLSDSDILALLEWMYHDFGLPEKFHIDSRTIRAFLYEVYKNYNEVPFHNFRHGFCVTQMMYAMACCVDVPSKVGDLETLILITSCICHDLDHPGYNNIYQINARTELALRYNDISPLENHHCSVAFRILELQECNILASLPSQVFRTVREGIIRCILATDMARHNEILAQFKDITPEFDFGNKSHTDLLSMVLIKVADISNEARPMHVAEPWLDRLLQEFFKQSDAEKMEGLPVTPFMDPNKITKPSSQCSFIGFVLLPLFEALGALLPQLHDMIVQPVREALEYYRRLNEQCREERIHRKSIVDLGDLTPAHLAQAAAHGQDTQALVKSGSGYSVKSRKSFQTVRSRSRSAEDEALERPQDVANTEDAVMENLREQDEDEDVETDADGRRDDDNAAADEVDDDEEEDVDEEEEEEETATEVEVSEKTLKFKISTESGRKSYPGSRKGSRDKSALSGDLAHQELTRAVRELHHHQHHHYHHGSAAPTRSSLATSPQSGRSTEFSRCNGDKDTKCLSFEDDTLSRSSHSPCSATGSKRGSTAGRGARSPQPPRDTSPLDSPEAPPSTTCGTSAAGAQSADARASPSPKLRSPTSFLKKLKNLTDRLSFSVSSDSSSREATSATASAGASPCHGANSPTASVCPGAATCPASPMLHQADGARARHGADAVDSLEMRATLPKTRGPRGWRSLLGAEPNPPERRRQASVNASPEADDGLDLAAAAVAEGEPTGNNNNRKKAGNLWSPGNRRGGGLLNRLKQSGDSIHSTGIADAGSSAEGTQGPQGSEGGAGRPGLMASLAASFRPKKPPSGQAGAGLPPAPTPAPQ